MIRTVLALAVVSAAAFAAEAPLLSLVPPEAKVIGGMQVDRSLASPLGRYLLSQIGEDDGGLAKFIEQTGFDPRRDVREILVAAPDSRQKNGVMIARGVFDGAKIIAAAQAHGALPTTYNGISIATGKRGQAVAVFEGSIAVMGAENLVKYAIDHRADSAMPSSALAQKAATLAGLYDGWMVADGGIAPPNQATKKSPFPVGAMLGSLLQTSAGIEFGSVIRLTTEAVTRSEKDAQALVDVVRFLATMVRNSGASNPEVQRFEPILNTLDVKAEAATVRMTVSVPEADIEQWFKPKRSVRRAAVRAARPTVN